jgi:hypothetical protein
MHYVITYGMLFAVPELKRLLLLRHVHVGEYCQGKGKGKGVSFDAMKAYRESRIIAKLLTSALDMSVQYRAPAALPPWKNPSNN